MARLILTRGIPGSGKSQWAKDWVLEKPGERIRLNRDELRDTLFGTRHGLSHAQEAHLTRVQLDAARAALSKGMDVVVDGTNLNDRYVRDWFRVGPVTFRDFPVGLATAILRDKERDIHDQVGEEVIRKFFKRTLNGNLRPAPLPPKTPEYKTYVPNPDLPPAIVVDIDGTIASIPEGGRSPYDYSRVSEDVPVVHVLNLLWQLNVRCGYRLIFLSGRDDSCRDATEDWLEEHVGLGIERLLMRSTGDKRDDALIKHELFHSYVAPAYNVRHVIDDRLRVRRMWHAIGAPLLSVGDPDANF